MAIEAKITTVVDNSQAVKAQQGLRKEIKNLRLELDKLEEGTAEYNQTFSKLSNLMKTQTDRMRALKTSSADLGDLLGNVGKVGAGIAGGFQAAQGAMVLFGAESEDLQKTLVNIQAAMSFTQGLVQLEELTKSLPALVNNVKGMFSGIGGGAKETADGLDKIDQKAVTAAGSIGEMSAEMKQMQAINEIATNKNIAIQENWLSTIGRSTEAIKQQKILMNAAQEAGDKKTVSQIQREIARYENNIKIANAELKSIDDKSKAVQNLDNIQKKSSSNFALGMLKGLGVMAAVTLAITGIVYLYEKLTAKSDEYIKRQAESAEKYKLISEKAKLAAESLAKINLLYSQWIEIKDQPLTERQKWFTEHKESLAKVGKGYKDLKTLEADWAVNGIKKYQQGIMKRAEATAAFNKLVELYDKRLRLSDDKRLKEAAINQNKYNELRKKALAELSGLGSGFKGDAEKELDRIGQGGTISFFKATSGSALAEFYKFVEAVRNSEVATTQSAAIQIAAVDKQIESYSKIADIKDEVTANGIDADNRSIESTETYTANIQKKNADIAKSELDNYTLQKAGLDEWLRKREEAYLKNEISESEFIAEKQKFNVKLNNLDVLQADDQLRIARQLNEKKKADADKAYNAEVAVINKNHKGNKKLLDEALVIKNKTIENADTELQNATIKRDATIKDLDIKAANDKVTTTKEMVDAVIKEYDRLINFVESSSKIDLNNLIITQLNEQSGKSFFGSLFDTGALKREQDKFNQEISGLTAGVDAKEGKKSALQIELESLNENTPEYKAKLDELKNLDQSISDDRVAIAQAEADKKKAINDKAMAITEGSITAATSSFQSIIDMNEAASAETQANLEAQYEQGRLTKEQYDKKLLDEQKKINEKNKKWQAGIAMVDGLVGAGKALTGAMELGPIAGPIVGGIQSAAILASTVATIRKIYAQRVSDSGAGGAISAATTSSVSPLNYVTADLTSESVQNLNTVQKVYVLESDITNAQRSVKTKVSESTF